MDELMVVPDVHIGVIELRQVYKTEGEFAYFGGYSITRDRHGNEISRTEPTYNIVVSYSKPEPKETLWQKIVAWMR